MNTSKVSVSQLGAVILAGGVGRRLPDKCFRMLGDKPLIVRVYERVSQVTEEIVFSVKNDEEATRIRRLIHPLQVVLDEIKVQTPLVGFLSGMRALRTPYVFAGACDIPFVEPNVIRHLYTLTVGRDGAIPVSDGSMPEPLCAVYRRQSAVDVAEKSLGRKLASMLDMIRLLDSIVWVSKNELSEFDKQQLTFRNINTDADLTWAEQAIKNLTANSSMSDRRIGASFFNQ